VGMALAAAPLRPGGGKVVYYGDVPVYFDLGGATFFGKLFEAISHIPVEIVEAGREASPQDKRIPKVRYTRRRFLLDRLEQTRFTRRHARWVAATKSWRGWVEAKRLGLKADDAVVTVAHGSTWLVAVEAARWAGARSIVFCHDEWTELDGRKLGGVAGKIYADTLGKASTVFAISEGMQRHLEERYAIKSEVFLPTVRLGANYVESIPKPPRQAPRLAYIGHLWPEYWRSLHSVASAAAQAGWQTDLHVNAEARRTIGTPPAYVHFQPFVAEERLAQHLAAEADALVVALDFSPGSKAQMATLFTSKLAEYTRTGLPIIVIGPPYAETVRWAKAQQCFYVVDDQSTEAVDHALQPFFRDETSRCEMGRRAQEVGRRAFAAERGVDQLLGACGSGRGRGPA